MYFTRKTETVLNVIAICAGKSGHSLTLWEIARSNGGNTEEFAECISLLLRHGLLKGRYGGRVALAIEPATTTLGAILRVTQPELARLGRHNTHSLGKNVLTTALEAASSNFLSIADKFTLADFLGESASGEQSPPCSSSRPGHCVIPSPLSNVGTG